jgi:hypothetical protein
MNPLLIGPIFDLGKSLIERLFPDKEKQAQERAQAELALATLAQDGRLKEMATQMSAILAEAQSADPWTSRARPSFLYVVYVLILFSLPMGILAAFSPELAVKIAEGMKAWLGAIPSEIIELFKWVMLGYIGGRSLEKVKGAAK